MKRISHFLLTAMIISALTACGSAPTAPTVTVTATDRPTATYAPSPTETNTPIPPLEGQLFFDMNGSGLFDEATFDYDQARLNNPLNQLERDYLSANPDTFYQPELIEGLQKAIDDYISENPDTLKDQSHPILQQAIDDYVKAHPDIQDGDLITMDEPALPGYTVCVQDNCVQTDSEGNFYLPNPSGASGASIKITDPYADFPAWAMRYINDWKGPVVVPAYTKDVDATTMARLTTIPECDEDLVALVCKFNDATLQVRDQHLNDTSIIPIANGTSIKLGADNNVGLMQGFLTLPFMSEQVQDPFILGGFDIRGNRCFKSDTTFDSTRDGVSEDYRGMYYNNHGDHNTIVPGVEDSHVGIDYYIQEGIFIVSASPTANVIFQTAPPDPELRMNTSFSELFSNKEYMDTYGHLDLYLVKINQQIYRGQIIGIGGVSGIGTRVPELHFDISEPESDAWCYRDQYRYIINLDQLPENFWGNPVSLWTSDNNPQFTILDQENK